ncbi:MAG: hypothetical protein R3242_11390 [Akkermansiaceae bacterium]|nr:hypothetical protein [Akkermansiaceae bacterium]
MRSCLQNIQVIATACGLLVLAVVCPAQEASDVAKPSAQVAKLKKQIAQLEQQNRNLQRSLTEANRNEREAAEQLDQVRTRLAALGKNLLDGGDDRLIQAAADLEIANERISRLEAVSSRLAAQVSNYMREAVAADPESRIQVETSLRELDAVLGLRQKPRPDVRTGSLKQSRIVSIDQESGMLVLNIGQRQGARIGMTFRLVRGQEPYGKAILADVRQAVSGVFVEAIDANKDISPRIDDLAILETKSIAE